MGKATMGGLIQTKGTQRLAKLFNKCFDDNATGIAAARMVGPLRAAFKDASLDLLAISDRFIAQNAIAGSWPADGNDYLYPSATMTTTNPTGGAATNILNFRLPAGIGAIPTAIAANSAVCSLDARKTIPHGTKVGVVSPITGGAGGTFNVTLVDKNAAPVNVTVTNLERISFAKGKHEQLVRRWRWYLKYDLAPAHHASIRSAISSALEDTDFNFTKITFQALEDTQRVLVSIEQNLNNSDEYDDTYRMSIILVTQQTTAPDPLDPQ